jgi:hypothetical protein
VEWERQIELDVGEKAKAYLHRISECCPMIVISYLDHLTDCRLSATGHADNAEILHEIFLPS